jgi:hypothetical protein
MLKDGLDCFVYRYIAVDVEPNDHPQWQVELKEFPHGALEVMLHPSVAYVFSIAACDCR